MGANGEPTGGQDHDEGRAVLVDQPGDRACAELLGPWESGPVDLLIVTIDGDAADRLAAIRERGLSLERIRVVTVGGAGVPEADRRFDIEDVQSVEALSELGRYVRDVVLEWDGGSATTVVCFDSVTALIERVDLPLTFEFMLVLVDAIRPAGATAYFLHDAAAHDEQTLRTIQHVFDETIGDDG